jgi:hypothetical protein
MQIEPGLDRDRVVGAGPRLTAQRMCEAAHLSSGIRVQCEAPADPAIFGSLTTQGIAGSRQTVK